MFQGIIPALVSPLREDNTIWTEAARRILDFELSQGADGFYICGGTGEGLVMQPEQREELASLVISHLRGRVPCIVHVAAMQLDVTLRLARQAESAGCDAVAAIPPAYFMYSEDDIYNYYRAISDAVHVPVMIYYHPAAGARMSAQFIARLFEIDNVTSVKWSVPDYSQMLLTKELTQGEINILNGPDDMLLCGLAMGADGGIGTTYNFLLPVIKGIYRAFQAGDLPEARRLQALVSRFVAGLQVPVIPAAKAVMKKMGYDPGYATYPMHRLTAREEEELFSLVRACGLVL